MPKSRAIKGIDEDMKLNKALWEMAEVLRNGGARYRFIQRGERIKPSPRNIRAKMNPPGALGLIPEEKLDDLKTLRESLPKIFDYQF